MVIARTSKRLGLRTEASARFERGCDPEGIDRAVRRLCELLAPTAGDRFRSRRPGELDIRGPVPDPARVRVRTARVNAILGSDLGDDQVVGYLEPIGFTCERESTGRARRDRSHVPPRHRPARSTSSKRWPDTTATPSCPGDVPSHRRSVASPDTNANGAWRAPW